jgi:hypothetical protein
MKVEIATSFVHIGTMNSVNSSVRQVLFIILQAVLLPLLTFVEAYKIETKELVGRLDVLYDV